MAVAKENTRTSLTISKEFKKVIEDIAKSENRSFNNLVITALKDYVSTRK